jgi:hypothetical protein
MSRRDRLDVHPSDAALAAALRALPESTPQPDLWPDLARTLAERGRTRWRRYAIPFAAAAALAIALLAPSLVTHAPQAPIASTPVVPSPAATAATPQDGELAALHERSRTLERWIAAVSARAPQDGRDLMAAVEVEDLIGLVDVQLGGSRGDADALPLWRQRVALLEDLAAIRGNGAAFAASDTREGAVPVSLNQLN